MRQFFPLMVSVAAIAGLGSVGVAIASAKPDAIGVQIVAQKPDCNNPQTQGAMNACAGLAYEQADKKLNQVYQQLLPQLSSSRRQKLIASQQAWLKFRDTNCAFARSEVEGGSLSPTIYGTCLANMSEQRTKQLEAFMNNKK